MRILLTDVTGLLGRAMARQLIAAGHTVTGVAAYPHQNLHPDVDFVGASLGDPVLQRLADAADVVLHLAPIEPGVPGSAGIDGLVLVAHAAARAGARLIYVSAAAGEPALYAQAETLVDSGWAPSLVVRIAPPVGRQLDWMVCRTVASLLYSTSAADPVRVLHVDDLIRFLVHAVATDGTGVVDLASPDTDRCRRRAQRAAVCRAAPAARARAELGPADTRPRPRGAAGIMAVRIRLADKRCHRRHRARVGRPQVRRHGRGGLCRDICHCPPKSDCRSSRWTGRRCGRLRRTSRRENSTTGSTPALPCSAPSHWPRRCPGPLTPMTLDVQIPGLRAAARMIGPVMACGDVIAAEWGSRAIAVFGHRPYVGVSASAIAAEQLPGWDLGEVVRASLGDSPVDALFPLGRPPQGGLIGSATAKAVVVKRALALLRHLKADTQAYLAAAATEHLAAAQLNSLSDAQLQARARLLRDRIHQGWALTGLWLIDSGVTAATVERLGVHVAITGMGALVDSDAVTAKSSSLAALIRGDLQLCALALDGDLAGINAQSQTIGAAFAAAVSGIGHRGPGEVELANLMIDDDPAILLAAAGRAATELPQRMPPTAAGEKLSERLAASARASRESAYDTTIRFTHELRMTLRELGSRFVSRELIDVAGEIFYLTCDEAVTLPSDARLRIKRRRAERERFQGLRLPDVITVS